MQNLITASVFQPHSQRDTPGQVSTETGNKTKIKNTHKIPVENVFLSNNNNSVEFYITFLIQNNKNSFSGSFVLTAAGLFNHSISIRNW